MKRTIKLSLCLLSALLTLLSCQEESIQADYQIIPLPQQIQLKVMKIHSLSIKNKHTIPKRK